MVNELIYSSGELTAQQLQEEITSFWTDLRESSKLRSEVSSKGIDWSALENINGLNAITVRPDSSGVDPASVLLIVAFAPAGNRVLKDLWGTIILPRIRKRWGDDAVGDESGRRNR
jgi:hypothetical protein